MMTTRLIYRLVSIQYLQSKALRRTTAQKSSGNVAVEIYSDSANDSWNVVKQYLDQEKAAGASRMAEHESHYLPDPENISDLLLLRRRGTISIRL
jgi:hypothetical protein